jgi:protein-S-isoprenylcysteine O-methyltransferase Ste14
MGLIKLFIIGATGYLLSGLYDVAVLYDKYLLKKGLYCGFFLTAVPYPIMFLTLYSPHGTGVIILLLLLIALFAALLTYSVLIEIPRSSNTNGMLYRGGTYSFSRHPGFIWYTVVNILIAVYFWDIGVALVCAGFIVCNLVLIAIEDSVLFPRMFAEYGEYRKETPFFLSLQNIIHRRS